jgi:hypothetical protein
VRACVRVRVRVRVRVNVLVICVMLVGRFSDGRCYLLTVSWSGWLVCLYSDKCLCQSGILAVVCFGLVLAGSRSCPPPSLVLLLTQQLLISLV